MKSYERRRLPNSEGSIKEELHLMYESDGSTVIAKRQSSRQGEELQQPVRKIPTCAFTEDLTHETFTDHWAKLVDYEKENS
jgi:hypothetical protein